MLYFAATDHTTGIMELKKLNVHNYKSLVNFELNEPNAFTVFEAWFLATRLL